MTSGVDVNIGADTREFETSVRTGMQEPVIDAQKALDQYVDAAGAGGQTLTRSFEDQQRSTVELKQDIDKLNSTIRDGSGPAYRKAASDSATFTHKTTEGFDEVKDSARQNAIEVGASFTGGFDQAAGGLQGFVAEFLAGFGPGGVIAGVGAAALIGLVTNAIDQGQQAAEAQKQAVTDLAQEYIEAGNTGSRSFDGVKSSIEAMATSDPSEVIITLQKAWTEAKASGADYQGIVTAIASASPAQIAKAKSAVDDLTKAHQRQFDAATRSGNGEAKAAFQGYDGATKLSDALGKAAAQASKAEQASKLAAKAGLTDWARQQDLVTQVEGAYDDAADSASDFINKQGDFNPGKFIKHMQEVRTELEHYKTDIAKTDLPAEAQHYLETQGAETAAAMLKGYKAASPKQQAQLSEIWSTAGDENATTYGAALGKSLSGIKPKAPTIPRPVVPAPDTSALQRFFATQQPRIRIGVDLIDRTGKRIG